MNKSKPEDSEVLPVEKQKIKGKFTHLILVIPALDERWVQARSFGYYVFPPTKRKDGKYSSHLKEEWLKTMSFVLDDIWWLCELPYHRFWSQVIFHKESMNGVQSFLHLAPLQKLYFRIQDNDILNMYKRIKKAVFQFLKRICRFKESSLHFMSEEKYEDVLSSNNLITISLMFCMCLVYTKEEQIEKMINDLFKYNKSLRLDDAVLRTTQLFSYIHKKLKSSYKDMKRSIEECECGELKEILNTYRKSIITAVQCITPAAMSISNFIQVYKDGCNVLSIFDFEYHIIRTYKKLLISLHEEVNLLFDGPAFEDTRSRLITMLNISRIEFLKIFYACLNFSLDKLSNNRESFDVVHNYVKVMKFALKVEEFVYDFNNIYSIEGLTKEFNKCNSNIDISEVTRIKEKMTESYDKLQNDTKISSEDTACLNGTVNGYENDFSKLKLDDPKELSNLIENYCIDFEFESAENSDSESNSSNSRDFSDNDSSSEYSDWTKNDDSGSEYEGYLSSAGELEGSDGFGDKKESRSSFDTLSDDHRIDQEFASDQPGPSGVNIKTLKVRSEIEIAIDQVKDVLPHLGDGFIVMCLEHYKHDPSAVINAVLEDNLAPALKPVDQNLPYIPPELLKDSSYDVPSTNAVEDVPLKELKKDDYNSYFDMLNDKKDVSSYKSMYEKYQIVSHDVYDDDAEEDYEDDTIPALEADPEILYNPNWKVEPFKYESDDDSEPEKQNEVPPDPKNTKKPLDFCENPEVVRARNDQRRRAKEERRRPNTYSRSRDNPSNSENQSDNTNRERHFKNVHKSRSGNHNRRYLSDRKRKA
ncbi:activating signal cointegrator 1 complex subunit 2 [Planococcus citri]|uniref:activating signal cointegrator 1 complex subunit 2 n=1 Tax=Planococcus citri TaxID=170843 RepID=UPI0031F910AE